MVPQFLDNTADVVFGFLRFPLTVVIDNSADGVSIQMWQHQ